MVAVILHRHVGERGEGSGLAVRKQAQDFLLAKNIAGSGSLKNTMDTARMRKVTLLNSELAENILITMPCVKPELLQRPRVSGPCLALLEGKP